MFGYFILIFSSSYGVTILDTIMTLGFGCFSKLARWFESGDTAGNDIRTRIGLSELILPHSRPGRTRRHGGDVPPPLCACLSPGDAAARFVSEPCMASSSSFFLVKGGTVAAGRQGEGRDPAFSLGCAGSALLGLLRKKHRLSNLLSEIGRRSPRWMERHHLF